MNLVVIEGSKAWRYEGKKRVEEADIQMEDQTISQFKAMLEDFRKNGLPPPVIQPADLAFNRLTTELTTKRPLEGLEDDELKALWDSVDDSTECSPDGRRAEAIHAELNRRGLGRHCAV